MMGRNTVHTHNINYTTHIFQHIHHTFNRLANADGLLNEGSGRKPTDADIALASKLIVVLTF